MKRFEYKVTIRCTDEPTYWWELILWQREAAEDHSRTKWRIIMVKSYCVPVICRTDQSEVVRVLRCLSKL